MAESQEGGTVIGVDTVIKGEMESENQAKILGRFEGTIKSKGQVIVSDKATCQADVHAKVVQVDGALKGNVTADEKVQLNATARITGDVLAAKLVVAEGASVDGHIRVGANAMKAAGSGATQNQKPNGSKPENRAVAKEQAAPVMATKKS